MMFLSFLFACEWLLDFDRAWGAPSATYLEEFDEWVTSYQSPGNSPDPRYLLFQHAAAVKYVAGDKVGNHGAIHPYFRDAGEPKILDRGVQLYWLLRFFAGHSHEVACDLVLGFRNDVRKEGEDCLSRPMMKYPKERADPQF
jgi:hypothetical protein